MLTFKLWERGPARVPIADWDGMPEKTTSGSSYMQDCERRWRELERAAAGGQIRRHKKVKRRAQGAIVVAEGT